MIIYSKVVDAPLTEPVTLAEAKTHLEVTGTAKDAYITTLIKVARRMCESYAGLSFVTQTRSVKLDRFPCVSTRNPNGEIFLPYGPVSEITEFTYVDENGDIQTLDIIDNFVLDTQSGLARVRAVDGWPFSDLSQNSVTIEYTAGVADDSEDLVVAKQAILLLVASLFENRQDEVVGALTHDINWNSKAILDTIKVYWNAES